MIMESISIDFRCKSCGNVRRTDVTDVSRSVISFRPEGWLWGNDGQLRCERCSPKVTVFPPGGGPAQEIPGQVGETAADMRARMGGMHIGGGGGGSAQPDYGIRQPPQVGAAAQFTGGAGSGGLADNILRDENGNPLAIIGPGGPGAGGFSVGVVEASTGQPPLPTHGATGGGTDAQAKPPIMVSGPGDPQWKGAPPVDLSREDSPKLFRPGGGGNVVFEDTRKSEFLGPEKIEAGVPSLGSKICIGCHQEINDGTVNGVAEAWRWAQNPENGQERGHPECLARIGR